MNSRTATRSSPARTWIALALACAGGCAGSKTPHFRPVQNEVPAAYVSQLKRSDAAVSTYVPAYGENLSPLDIDESTLASDAIRFMTLEDCIQLGLQNSKLLQDLGGTVLRSPQTASTNFEPALAFTDPRFGEEAALSAFDANLFASVSYEQNDRAFNNQFFGVGGNFQQDLMTSQFGINKRSATGGLLTIRDVAVYDRNNQQGNRFLNNLSWDHYIEAEMRQPLLQGAGTEFNRIAGPGALPGQFNGVLLARVRTDISLVDFEKAVRDYLADVENAYWDLYFAYRDLDARMQVRDIAQETVERYVAQSAPEGQLAQAREQLLRFQAEVIDSLNGRAVDGTRVNNGTSGGTFRGTGGVRISERKLRLMIGLPINDGTLIQTLDNPTRAPFYVDWNDTISQALQNREELRRQRWVVKQRQLELIASKNFMKPQLDAIALYRSRGFGNTLRSPFESDLHEMMMGVDFRAPVGFRRASAGVRNSELNLARDVELLKEQERSVHFGLSNVVNEAKRAFETLDLQRRRLEEIVKQLEAISGRNEGLETAELDVLLETHRRLVDARVRFHQAEVEYALSLRNINLEKGALLAYCNVWLSEGGNSSHHVYQEAGRRLDSMDYTSVPPRRDVVIGEFGR